MTGLRKKKLYMCGFLRKRLPYMVSSIVKCLMNTNEPYVFFFKNRLTALTFASTLSKLLLKYEREMKYETHLSAEQASSR